MQQKPFGAVRSRAVVWRCAVLAVSAASLVSRAAPEEDIAKSSPVALSGGLSGPSAPVGKKIRFWITIENRSDKPIERIQYVSSETPGFQILLPCSGGPPGGVCGPSTVAVSACAPPNGRNSATPPPANELCAYLERHQSFTVWGELTAGEVQPPHAQSVVLSWRRDAGSSLGTVSLGQAEAVRAWQFRLLSFTPWLTIASPLLLALLGYGFTLWMRRREERAQTWNAMLLESHRSSMHYFMPAASMIGAAVAALAGHRANAGNKNDSPFLRRGFYYLVMFQWWHQETFREVGAYHFKARFGEEILQALYAKHQRLARLQGVAARRLLDRVLSHVRKNITLNEFLEMLDYGTPDIARAWRHVQRWARGQNCARHLAVLGAYRKILVYEVNRNYLAWYGSLEPIKLSPEERTEIVTIAAAYEENPEFARRARAYLARAERPSWRARFRHFLRSVNEMSEAGP